MNRSRFAVVLAMAALSVATPALAQGRGLRAPAEAPPAGYAGMQFVDSRGCAFVRAGISGEVVWVPRVNRDRSQICNQPPTFAGRGSTAVAAATTPAATPAAPAARVEPPARAPAGAPIETVASRLVPPAAAPAATPAAAPAAPLTMADVCRGRSGVLPDYRTASGGPVDCGGTPPVPARTDLPAAATAPVPVRLTLAEVCEGRSGPLPGYVNAATGQPVSCGSLPAPLAATAVAPEAAPVLTLAAVCTGHEGLLPGYRTAAGGPVICGAVPAPAPARVAAAACPPGVVGGVAYRCGGAAIDPLSSSTLSLGGMARALEAPRLVTRAPVSNPAAAPAAVAPPPGYAPVWDDGRINPARGLPAAPAAVVNRAPAPAGITAAPTPAAGHRFVQIGTFGEAANAQRAVAALRALGLPAATQAVTRGGRSLTVVAAGPFADAAALGAALGAARAAGYADAFTRG